MEHVSEFQYPLSDRYGWNPPEIQPPIIIILIKIPHKLAVNVS